MSFSFTNNFHSPKSGSDELKVGHNVVRIVKGVSA